MKPARRSKFKPARIRIEAFNVRQLIKEVISIYETEAHNKGLNLDYTLRDPVDTLWVGSPTATRRILIKLLSAALQDTDSEAVRLELKAKYNNSIKACFSITDGNLGLSQKFHEQLVLARDMASEVGGTVELDDNCPSGTHLRLHLNFEIGDPIAPNARPRKQAVRKLLQNRRALVADDLDFNRYINSEILSRMGAKVDTADDGQSALEQLKSTHYDLALLDIDMPGLTGIDAVQQYLSGKPAKHTEFIALSAHATSEMEQACINAGFKLFIHKPLTQQKITAQLAETFNRSKEPTDTSLLEYLARDSPSALEQLKTRQQKAYQLELTALQKHHDANDIAVQRRSVHKLIGVASIQRDPEIIGILEKLSTELKASPPPNSIGDLINQLSDALTNQ